MPRGGGEGWERGEEGGEEGVKRLGTEQLSVKVMKRQNTKICPHYLNIGSSVTLSHISTAATQVNTTTRHREQGLTLYWIQHLKTHTQQTENKDGRHDGSSQLGDVQPDARGSNVVTEDFHPRERHQRFVFSGAKRS